MKKLAIFDLDGTLINTIADLANSTNYALERCGFTPHPISRYNFFVGNGINKLFERALPEGRKSEQNIQDVRKEFLLHYDIHNTDFSSPYPGIPELLQKLQSQNIRIAIASNKYQSATLKLIKHYFPTITFTAILGQRENIPIKPDPFVINEIISISEVKKEEVIYIGDSGVDMKTCKNAGVTGVGVTWGFRPKTELEAYQPDYIVNSPAEIPEILRTYI